MASGNRRERELAREHHRRQEQRRSAERQRRAQQRKVAVAVTVAVLGVVLVAGLATWLRSRSTDEDATATAGAGPTGPCAWTPTPPGGGGPVEVPPPPTTPDTTGTSTATLTLKGLGDVRVSLDAARAPCAVTSFRHLAALGFFDSTPCHRLTTGPTLKVLQCGDPGGSGSGGPGYSFADENLDGATYPAGTLAMANSGPDTNGSQFFLVYADSQLEPNYTPFGRITAGLGVLKEVAAAGVAGGGQDGKPARAVQISAVTVRPPVAGSPGAASPTASGSP